MGYPASLVRSSGYVRCRTVAVLDLPRSRCTAVRATALAIAVAIAAIGLTVTIVRLHRRRTAWPFAVATLALCVIAFFLGGVGYAVAVGA